VDPRRPGAASRALGQHFLRSRQVAARVVRRARIQPTDVVVEIGAGTGRLTHELAARAHLVVAVEVDPRLAVGLVERFHADPKVVVVAGDILALPPPALPHRAFGNIPFGLSTRLLRQLLDGSGPELSRIDLIVAEGVARKRVTTRPSNLLNAAWAPWWSLRVTDRFRPADFAPAPPTGAALLTASRRSRPLLPASERADFVALLRRAFVPGNPELRRTLPPLLPPRVLKRLARDIGFERSARPTELGVFEWIRLFDAWRDLPPTGSMGDAGGRGRDAGGARPTRGSRPPKSTSRGSADDRS
jgi:23S rRNA (adenine-N6)-dimethyltransferase